MSAKRRHRTLASASAVVSQELLRVRADPMTKIAAHQTCDDWHPQTSAETRAGRHPWPIADLCTRWRLSNLASQQFSQGKQLVSEVLALVTGTDAAINGNENGSVHS